MFYYLLNVKNALAIISADNGSRPPYELENVFKEKT